MCCSFVSNTNGPKTLLGTRMHHESPHFVVTREHSKYTNRAPHALTLPVLSVS